MDCECVMEVLSQCGLGALLLKSNGRIAGVNAAGDRLLHGNGELIGKRLQDLAPELCDPEGAPAYANIAFGEYLALCPGPAPTGLPPHTRMITFRDATDTVHHEMLRRILEQMSEAVLLCDAQSRIWTLNEAAVKLDSVLTEDVRGETIERVYHMLDGTELALPRVLRDKRPLLGQRQYYTTRYGRKVDVVSSNYPIFQNGHLLGAFNILQDWSDIEDLHKKIIDLQAKLLEATAPGKKAGKNTLAARYTFRDIISISPSMANVIEQCRQVAKTDSAVMFYGETGTGKELFAQSIHNASRRAKGPFLAINCAAIPENLLEGLLFGTEKGAYTGAECRPGLFEQADGGTLLFDEINSMNMNLQSKLLRVLQDGVIRRVGGTSEMRVNVRVLSNTNVPPYQAIAENTLRRDLFYRLGVVNINLPPLRDRREDIPLLAKRFIMQCNRKLVRNIHDVDPQTLERFAVYGWPGNVRELQHAIEHAINILPDERTMITLQDLPPHILDDGLEPAGEAGASFSRTKEDFERNAIVKMLQQTGGNVSAAARQMQMSRQNLQYYIKRHRINVEALLRSL